MKAGVIFTAILLCGSAAQAQHACRHSAGTETSQGYAMNGSSSGSGGGAIGSAGGALQYEPPKDYKVGYARNDGAYVPTTYMYYDDALALGRQQLATGQELAQNRAAASLGEIARAYRTARVPPLQLEARAIQDNSGKVEVCKLRSNNCRRL